MRNKVNYLLVNLCLFFSIIFLIYLSRNVWTNLFIFLKKIFGPFIYAFFIAYFFSPVINFFRKFFSNSISIFLFILFLFIFFVFIIVFIFPVISNQFINIINYLLSFFNFISDKYNFNLSTIEGYLVDFIKFFGDDISNYFFSLFGSIVSFVIKFLIVISISIYFILDMDKFKNFFSKNFSNYKFYDLLVLSNNELRCYCNAFFKIMFISFFEYLFAYKIIGHPYFFALAFLTSIFSIIPVFGNSFVNILSCITALVVGKDLFFRCVLIVFVLSIIDSYVINPIIFGNSNNVHPVIVIFSIIVGGILGGILGVFLSLPIIIIFLKIVRVYWYNFYNFFKKKL